MSSIKNNNFMTNVALMIMIDYLWDFMEVLDRLYA